MKLKMTAMIGGLMALATTSFALPPMWKTFQETYKVKKDGVISKASCVVCHVSKGKTALNKYGEDLKTELKGSRKLTADNLKAIEGKDSNGNGVKNGDEIKNDTLPGEVKSK